MGWQTEAGKIRAGLARGDYKQKRNYADAFMKPFVRGIERQEAARIVEEREERARVAREEKEAADRQRELDKADKERQELVNLLAMRKEITLTPEINKQLMTTAKAGKLENINDLEQYYDDYLKYEAPRNVEVPLNQIEGTLPPEMRAREESISSRKNKILNLPANKELVKNGKFTQEELNEFADKASTNVFFDGVMFDLPQPDPASLQMQELGITKSDPKLVYKAYQKDVLEMDIDEVKYALSQDGLTEERRLELERREKSFATDPTFKEVIYYLPDGSERRATTLKEKTDIENEIKALEEANKNLKEGEEPKPVWSRTKPAKDSTQKNQTYYKLRLNGSYDSFTANSAQDIADIEAENSILKAAGEAEWSRIKPPAVKEDPTNNWMTKDVTGQNAVGYMANAKQALQKVVDPRGELGSVPSDEEQKIRDRIAVIKKVIYSENDLMRPKDIDEAKRFLSIATSIGDADAIKLNNDFITSQQANISPEITFENWVKIENVDGEDVGTIQRVQRKVLGDGSEELTYIDENEKEVKVTSQSVDFRKLAEDELSEYMKLEKARSSAIKNFEAKRTALAGTVGLASQMVDIVNQDEDVLNLGGKLAVGLQSFSSNIEGIANIFEKTFFVDTSGMNANELSSLAQKQAATANSLLTGGLNNVDLTGTPSDESIAQAFGINASAVDDLAYRTALFTAKKYLLAFKLGGSLGTSGTAMSNADRERFEKMIQPSTDSKAFIDNIKQIVEQSAFELNVDAQGFNNLEAGFNAMAAVNGYKLAYQSVSTWEEFYKSNDELEGYWNNITGGVSNKDFEPFELKNIETMTKQEKIQYLKELQEYNSKTKKTESGE